MAIRVFYTAIDGASHPRDFKTLAGARKYAARWIGEHPEMGSHYAVSGDGVGKVQVEGCTIAELFPQPAAPADPYAGMTDLELQNLANESEAAFRQAEWDADHEVEPQQDYGMKRSPGCTCSDAQLTHVGCDCHHDDDEPTPPPKDTNMTDLIDSLPLSALVAIHNGLTANQVRKFENRTKAKRRILDVLKNHGGMTFNEAARARGFEAPTELDGEPIVDAALADTRDHTVAERDEHDAAARHDRREAQDDADRRADRDARDLTSIETPTDTPRIVTIAAGSLMTVNLTVGEIAALAQLVFAGPPSLGEDMATTLLEKLRTATPATPSKPPRAARAARAATPNPREGGMTAAQRTITDLCQRPQGATGKELAEGCGWPSIAARATCQKLADRFGFTLTETAKTEGRGIAFYMTPHA